jgi:hypothetical protein
MIFSIHWRLTMQLHNWPPDKNPGQAGQLETGANSKNSDVIFTQKFQQVNIHKRLNDAMEFNTQWSAIVERHLLISCMRKYLSEAAV